MEGGDITVANSRFNRQDDGFERTDYRGSFNVSGPQSDPNISGALREIDFFRGGAQIPEVTNIARDAGRDAGLIGDENTSRFLNFLFSSGDSFIGSAGNDRLRSFGGNDTVQGDGDGDTLLVGGGGSDRFAFRQNEGGGRIVDFTHGQDKIVIRSGADGFGDHSFRFANGDVRISFSNVAIAADTDFIGRFNADDFVF